MNVKNNVWYAKIIEKMASSPPGCHFTSKSSLSDYPEWTNTGKYLDLTLILRRIHRKQYKSRPEKLISDVNTVWTNAISSFPAGHVRYQQATDSQTEFFALLSLADKEHNRPLEALEDRLAAIEQGIKAVIDKLDRREKQRSKPPSKEALQQLSAALLTVPDRYRRGVTTVAPELFVYTDDKQCQIDLEKVTMGQYRDLIRYIKTCKDPVQRGKPLFTVEKTGLTPEEEFMRSIRKGQAEIMQARATPGSNESSSSSGDEGNGEMGDNGGVGEGKDGLTW